MPWGNTKPPVGTELDYGDPLTEGLLGALPFNEGAGARAKNSVTHRFDALLPNQTSFTWGQAPPGGRSLRSQPAGTDKVTLREAFTSTITFSIAGRFFLRSIGAGAYAALFTNSAGTEGLYFTQNLGFNLFFSFDHVFAVPTPINTSYTFLLSVNAGTANLYTSGKLHETTLLSIPSMQLEVLCNEAFSSFFDGDYDYLYWWNRALTEMEAERLLHEPYGFYLAPTRRVQSARPWTYYAQQYTQAGR